MSDPRSAVAQIQSLVAEGKRSEAKALGAKALRRAPGDPDLHCAMCFLATQEGRSDDVLRHARVALAARWNDAASIINIARMLTAADQVEEATRALHRAIAVEPSAAEAYVGLATLGFMRGDMVEYESACRRGLEHAPGHGGLMRHLAAALRKVGRMREALEVCHEGARLNPADEALAQEAAFNSNYPSGVSPESAFEAHRRFGRLLGARATPWKFTGPGAADADRRIRVGFMSADFRQHSVAHFAEPLVASLDPAQFDTFLYHTHTARDEVTERFRALASNWCDAGALEDEALAARIAADGVDILIDLGGLTSKSRCGVLACKPAPLQASYLGYPNTTGLATVDVRFVDSNTDPPGPSDRLSVERLVRLDPCFLCYRPWVRAPDPAPLPMATSGIVTLGCFNALAKMSDECVEMWAGVLQRIAGARLVLKNADLVFPTVRRHVLDRFAAHGIDAGRLDLLPFASDTGDHLRTYHRIDIALDSFPYHGTTTTCEALLMGVPVITRAGAAYASRVGVSILKAVGLDRFVASDRASFERAAATLAADRATLSLLRSGLRQRLFDSVLCDAQGMGRRFGAALRAEWKQACSASPAVSGDPGTALA